MAEKKGLGLPQTRGSYQIRGKVTGTQRDSFYTEKLTKTSKNWRSVSFGAEFADGKTVYLSLNGMEKDEVYFSKKDENGKTETKKVPWKDRAKFAEKDYRLIGINVGVKKTTDAKGNTVNDKKVLVDYDACEEIGTNLVDDVTIFSRGTIEFGSYNGKHTTKFVPNQVSLAKDVEFDAIDFQPLADFTQTIVFMSCKPNEEKTRATVEAKIVNYDSIEDAEFMINDMNLAKMFVKNLKPYTSIKVWGNIEVAKNTEEVETTDCWGSSNNMEKVNAPTVRELIITGADSTTIDKDTYSEKAIDEAIEKSKASKTAEKDFGGVDDTWGSVKGSSSDDDDELAGW